MGGWGGGEKPTLVHDGIMLEHHDTEHGIYVAHFYLCVFKMWKGLDLGGRGQDKLVYLGMTFCTHW